MGYESRPQLHKVVNHVLLLSYLCTLSCKHSLIRVDQLIHQLQCVPDHFSLLYTCVHHSLLYIYVSIWSVASRYPILRKIVLDFQILMHYCLSLLNEVCLYRLSAVNILSESAIVLRLTFCYICKSHNYKLSHINLVNQLYYCIVLYCIQVSSYNTTDEGHTLGQSICQYDSEHLSPMPYYVQCLYCFLCVYWI